MNKSDLTPLQRFWRLLKPDKKEIRNVYIYAIFAGLVSLSLPLGIQAIVNLIQGGQIRASWVLLVTFVVLGVAVTGILQIFQLRITENLQQKIFSRAAFEFAYRTPRIKMEELYGKYAPELMNRFFDTITVQKGLSKILIDFSASLLQVVFGLILLSLYHSFFILFSLILVLLIFLIFRLTARRGLDTSLVESKYKYKVAHWLEEMARIVLTFKLAGKSDLPLDRVNSHVGQYLHAREGHFRVLVQQYSLLIVFKVMVATGLLAIGGILVMEQLMNIGQFIAAEIIILIVMNSVEKLIMSLETIYDVLTSLAKIGQVTDLELERDSGIDISEETDEALAIELKDVSFSYPGHSRKVINNISLQIKSGERLVISGANDSGKSTLLQIIAAMYEPTEGSVSYNGFAKGNLNLRALRSIVGDALDHELLFEGSILENICMGRINATFENVKWAVKNLGLNEFIKNLPHGYETHMEPRGKNFSESMVRKLLLARSIADKPKLLLMENALEPVDKKYRQQVIDFLTSEKNPWTLVAVSNNKQLLEKADRIIMLEEGKIVKSGTYSELKDLLTENQYA